MVMGLDKSIQFIKGVGPKRVKLFERLNIHTVNDLLHYYPRRYLDRSRLKPINELSPGEVETVFAYIGEVVELRPKKNIRLTKIVVKDQTGSASAVWFNQPYLLRMLKKGEAIFLSGKIERRFGEIQFSNPEFELFSGEESLNINRIVPVYPGTEGLSQKVIRSVIASCLQHHLKEVDDNLPPYLIHERGLVDKATALQGIHFPNSTEDYDNARKRLVFEELFILQLVFAYRRGQEKHAVSGIALRGTGQLLNQFFSLLPFDLTQAQERVWHEIKVDLENDMTMHRLVQGDVGSGKTVLAALSLLQAVEAGYQGALMVPTEILAEQHFKEVGAYLETMGVRVELLIGSLGKKEKDRVLRELEDGTVDVAIGTHALIQQEVNFARLGLVITDEQHRFGVRQRNVLVEKGSNPNVLVMTATPIPRTLALTLYGDLDISIMDELPPGRQRVQTYWLPSSQRGRVFGFCEAEIKKGRQIYFVCPLVEESEKLEVEAATKLVETLRNDIFPHRRTGLLHGRIKTEEKEKVMMEFREHQLDILVATTVVEVGVNVPNATIMVVEDAERFGLAQLHQLRGRVGRGEHQSYCVLVSDVKSQEGQERLRTMCKVFDGFRLAEEDLKLRGPGELLGTRQHGLPSLKLTNLFSDRPLLELARQAAFNMLQFDPLLNAQEHKLLNSQVSQYIQDEGIYTTA